MIEYLIVNYFFSRKVIESLFLLSETQRSTNEANVATFLSFKTEPEDNARFIYMRQTQALHSWHERHTDRQVNYWFDFGRTNRLSNVRKVQFSIETVRNCPTVH